MKIFRHVHSFPSDCRGSVIVLGNFDGFHKGHQKVIGAAGKIASELRTTLTVLSMEPHPRMYFNPSQKEFRLNSFRTKSHLLENFGVDHFIVLPFDKNLATMEAEDFVLDLLLEQIGALHIVVGYDYCFGAGRRGGVNVLGWLSSQEQFGLTVVEKVMEDDHIYSSSNIRDALEAGDVRKVADRLGHWWHVEGHVRKGDQRGRTINFPTANLFLDGYIEPKYGVYAVRIIIEAGEHIGVWDAVANVGRRPTFDKKDVLLESHIFDFDHDIYEHLIKVEFVDFIRPEMKFDGLESLKAQIEKDCVTARELLALPQNQQSFISSPRLEEHL
ncbi:MAG: bifunctional riboflavin kinase/FAD synthetase [Gammaproteobacteria bacterium]|nr:bifunctional riboflavin kinase/FAD synthetase [Gammaproteobacteria bacterium]MBT5073553.1 bifunctional riboflavin kinase/FAD synthetase [Kordiimonadaceae bacterium]MBT6037221.1 bifunctional riboflavin kinase/FAD synthetase [Kordiimonadaceae bacterium]MBT7583648.1 bifunctional riboflavin kinase/FAD synthetase [Kordiimonadaceae bacterium]